MDGVEYYRSDCGDEYILFEEDGIFRTVNIKGGLRWSIPSTSHTNAIIGLTKMNGKFVFKKAKSYVKKASEIVKILEDDGYIVDKCGDWCKSGRTTFIAEMFQCCRKPIDPNDGLDYEFINDWIEEL